MKTQSFNECQIHKQQSVAIDLNYKQNQEFRCICLKCVNERYFAKDNLFSITELTQELKQMKVSAFQAEKLVLEQKIQSLQILQGQVQSYVQQIQKGFKNMECQINSKINQIKNKLEYLPKPNQSQVLKESELTQLTQYLKSNRKIDIKQLINQENDNEIEFIQKIKLENEKLDVMKEFKMYQQRLEELTLDSNNFEKNMSEEELESLSEHLDHLTYKCKIHQEYYYMVQLQQVNQDDRFLCLQCLAQKQNQGNRYTIKQVEELWKKVQASKLEQFIKFQNQRSFKFEKIHALMKNFVEKQHELQQDILDTIQKQNTKIENELNQFKVAQNNQKSLYKMNIYNLNDAINTLEKEEPLNQQHQKAEVEDYELVLKINQKLESLISLQNDWRFQQQNVTGFQSQKLSNIKENSKHGITKDSNLTQNNKQLNAINNNIQVQCSSQIQNRNQKDYQVQSLTIESQLKQSVEKLKSELQDKNCQIDCQDKQIVRLNQEISELNSTLWNLKEQLQQQQQYHQAYSSIAPKTEGQNFSYISNQQKSEQNGKTYQSRVQQSSKPSQQKDSYSYNFENQMESPYKVKEINTINNIDKPVVLLITQSQRCQEFIMKSLFSHSNTVDFQKYYSQNLDLNVIKTDIFEFEEIDERERQIKIYQQIFRENVKKLISIWVSVEYDRTDMMNKQLTSIIKHLNTLKISISIIVVDFSSCKKNSADEEQIRKKIYERQKPKEILFLQSMINMDELVCELKRTIPFNREQLQPIEVKGSIFEEENTKETEQMLKDLKQGFAIKQK